MPAIQSFVLEINKMPLAKQKLCYSSSFKQTCSCILKEMCRKLNIFYLWRLRLAVVFTRNCSVFKLAETTSEDNLSNYSGGE